MGSVLEALQIAGQHGLQCHYCRAHRFHLLTRPAQVRLSTLYGKTAQVFTTTTQQTLETTGKVNRQSQQALRASP